MRNVVPSVSSRQARQAGSFLGTNWLKFNADDQELIREAERAHGYDQEQETEVSFAGLVVRFIVTLIAAAIRGS